MVDIGGEVDYLQTPFLPTPPSSGSRFLRSLCQTFGSQNALQAVVRQFDVGRVTIEHGKLSLFDYRRGKHC